MIKKREIIYKKGFFYTIHYITKQERLQYFVPIYSIPNNLFIEIYDRKNKCFRQLAVSNCEIEIRPSTFSEEEELKNLKFYIDKYKEYNELFEHKEYDNKGDNNDF